MVDLHHYWVEFTLEDLFLGGEFLNGRVGVGINPGKSLLGKVLDLGLVFVGEVILQFSLVEGLLHLEAVVLNVVLGIELELSESVLGLVFLGVSNHSLDLLLGESTLVVGNGNFGFSAGLTVESGDLQDTIGIDVKSDNDLWDTLWCWGDTSEVKLSEEMVVLGHLSLSLVDLDEHDWLIVDTGGEGLGLSGWDGSVSINDVGHDTTLGLDTHGKWGNIEEEKLGGHLVSLSGEDSGLNGGTEGNSLIWVNGLVEGSSTEEVTEHGLDLWDSSGSSDQNDLVNLSLTETGILEDVLDWWHTFFEVFSAKLLELGSGDVGVEIFTLVEGLALNWGLMGR